MVPMLVIIVLVCGARGARTVNDDLSKYWEKDFKEVGHLYGKTSDKELYGVSLPPSMIYNAPTTKKNDLILEHTGNYEDSGFDSGSTYPYKYNKHVKDRQPLKPEQSMNYFSYSETDANKKLEQINANINKTPPRENQNVDLSSKINLQGFKPYFLGNGENEHTSIRNDLSTERNQIGAGEVISEDYRLYRNKPRNKVRQYKGKTFNFRTKCPSRNCRKKSNTSKRISRPVKRVKKKIIVY